MTSGPLFEVVQSIKGLVIEVLDESRRALDRFTISESTTLVELSALFGALATPITTLGNALQTLSSGMSRLSQSGASPEQIEEYWRRVRRPGN